MKMNSNIGVSPGSSPSSYIKVEEFDQENDTQFIKEIAIPYFKDIFNDLAMRSQQQEPQNQNKNQQGTASKIIEKAVFYEYFKLPGILNDRLYKLIISNQIDLITEKSFITTMIRIFMSPLETRLRLTFNMYDFNSDGMISKEDVRIIFSFIPFKQIIKSNEVLTSDININSQVGCSDSNITFSSCLQNQKKHHIPKPQKIKLQNFTDSKDQSKQIQDMEIEDFLEKLFTKEKQQLNFEQYSLFNLQESSVLFYSLMAILHSHLPFSANFFRLKNNYRQEMNQNKKRNSASPSRFMAQPQLVKQDSPWTLKVQVGQQQSKNKSIEVQNFLSPNSNSAKPPHTVKRSIREKLTQLSSSSVISEFCFEKQQPHDDDFQNLSSNSSQETQQIPNRNIKINIQTLEEEGKKSKGSHNAHLQADNHYKIPIPKSPYNIQINNSRPPSSQMSAVQTPSSSGANDIKDKISKYLKNRKLINSSNHTPSNQMQQNIDLSSPFTSCEKKPSEKIENLNCTSKFKQIPKQVLPELLPIKQKQVTENQLLTPLLPLSKKNSLMDQRQKIKTNNLQAQSDFVLLNFQSTLQSNLIIDSFGYKKDETKQVFLEGKCFLKAKSNSYISHWLILLGNELYSYRNKGDANHNAMHSLEGIFLKALPPINIHQSELKQDDQPKGVALYPLKLILSNKKSRILYFETAQSLQKWDETIKQVINTNNIEDFYELGKVLGKGQFGQVRQAVNKVSGEQVAIKIIEKKNLKPIEIFQQRREIEVLKLLQHANIVNLVEVIENSEFYYIVLEHLAGGDLFDYLERRKFRISELRAKQIAFQLSKAVYYIHKYGIVHRDLKLENILMTDDSEEAVPKIVDFGLTKIIGPTESTAESFGTVGYIAPEVILKQHYSFSCDLWSLGCIIYALCSGQLPFDHKDEEEIKKRTLERPLNFDNQRWKNISQEAKELLIGLLQKKPEERLNMEQVLESKWFSK